MADIEEISTRQADPLALSGRQSALYGVLLEKDQQLADVYMGALIVLFQNKNPDRYAQAAHSIRELIEKLPRLVDVPIIAQQETLKQKVRELEDVWQYAHTKTKCLNSLKWDGEIDRPLSKMLTKLVAFFEWFGTHYPRRKEEITETLRHLDVSGESLPTPIEELNVKRWDRIKDFFIGVAHHGKYPENEEFVEWLNHLETILLDSLLPRTFDDLETIDTIIREGEADA